MRALGFEFMRRMLRGQLLQIRDLQSRVYGMFPDKCDQLGVTASAPVEPKWRKDLRWALQDAKHRGLMRRVGSPKSGLWERI